VRKIVLSRVIAFVRDDRGVTLVEYGIAITVAILVGTLALPNLATSIGGVMGAVGASLPD
jgi:Flp pilus assembly pilin Flp